MSAQSYAEASSALRSLSECLPSDEVLAQPEMLEDNRQLDVIDAFDGKTRYRATM